MSKSLSQRHPVLFKDLVNLQLHVVLFEASDNLVEVPTADGLVEPWIFVSLSCKLVLVLGHPLGQSLKVSQGDS